MKRLTKIEWLAIMDALLFTERECGLVSDAHLRAKRKACQRLKALTKRHRTKKAR